MHMKLVVSVIAALWLAGCHPEGGDQGGARSVAEIEEQPETQPTEPLVKPSREVARSTPSALPMLFPFETTLIYDRTRETKNYAEHREVLSEVIGGDIGQRAREIDKVMTDSGFEQDYLREADGIYRAKYKKEGVFSVFVVLRPRGVGPAVKSDAAIGSLLMTQGIRPRTPGDAG